MSNADSQRKWRETHIEFARAKEREYARKNRQRKRDNSRRWYAANREYVAAYIKAYRAANPEKKREWNRKRAALRVGSRNDGSARKYWRMIITAYRGLCAYCDKPYAHMDHVIPLSNGGAHVASNIRPACARCNLTKNKRTWTPRPWAAALPSEV